MNQNPKTPQEVNITSLTTDNAIISWKAGYYGAKSWVIHWSVNSDSEDPKEAIYMWLVEEPTFTISDDIFGGIDDKLAGNKLIFYVQEFNKKFLGKDPIEKADKANKTGYGSEWSTPLVVNFPKTMKNTGN